MWNPPSCEELLYSYCIGVVNLTFSIYIYIYIFRMIYALMVHNRYITIRHNGVDLTVCDAHSIMPCDSTLVTTKKTQILDGFKPSRN